MTANVNKFNKLVLSFLKDTSESNNIDELWMEQNVQSQVKSLCSSVGGSAQGKKNKDPLAPKRGKSGYLYFCSEFRNEVKASLGEQAKATDVTKELGLRWNALKDSKKPADKKILAGYEKMAADDKDRYQNEKSVYTPPESDDSEKPKRRGGKQKSNNGPKRAKSGYLYFCEDQRNQLKVNNPALKSTEITSELGRLWNELKNDVSRASEIAKYESLALEDKQRYESQKSETADSKPTKEVVKKEVVKKEVVKKEVVKKEVPKKGAKKQEKDEEDEDVQEEVVTKKVVKDNSKSVASKGASKGVTNDTPNKKLNGYQKYSEVRRPALKNEFSNEKPADITKRLSDEWKVLSKEDKQKWTDA
jgi:hypothetical protein